MQTLLVGYGKIGQIKAAIWQSLGRTVHVYDPDQRKAAQIVVDGHVPYDLKHVFDDRLIVDISTPANAHLESLKWVLDTLSHEPASILIEKPLASGPVELDAFVELLADPDFAYLNKKVHVNESYYLSAALDYVIEQIKKHNASIQSVHIELSKNRLDDVANGRFTDPYLGSLGIELPHMIAMAHRLGYPPSTSHIQSVEVHVRPTVPENEGVKVSLDCNGIPIIMESYLGDFRLSSGGEIAPNNTVIRTLRVATDGPTYMVELDPVKGLDRYVARIRIVSSESAVETTVISDNHLARHLQKLHEKLHGEMIDPLLSIENAIDTTVYVLELRAKVKQIIC